MWAHAYLYIFLQSYGGLEDISCRINQDVKKNIGLLKYQGAKHQITNITCKLNSSDKEVYVPFSFIKTYFDVSWQIYLFIFLLLFFNTI